MLQHNYYSLVIKGEHNVNIETSVGTPSMAESNNFFACGHIENVYSYLQTLPQYIPTLRGQDNRNSYINALIRLVLDGGS